MRDWINLCEASWDTDEWWVPKLDPSKPGNHGPGDWHPDGVYARFGVPEETENRYSNGQCMWLALAMAKRFGWIIKAQMYADEPTHIAHAYCVAPNGQEIDILGPQEKVDIFDNGPIREFTESEMVMWLKQNSKYALDPEEFNDHLNDALKAVDLFIIPKIKSKP